MKPFPLTKLVALSLTLTLMVPPAGMAQERDDFLDDFLPEAPLQPLDQIVNDPAPDGWINEVLGDPGEVPSAPPVADAAQADATPDAASGFALPEGWTWHEITISESVEEVSYPVRIGFPDEFFMIDPEVMPEFGTEEGAVSFTNVDLTQMTDAVMAGESAPYGSLVAVGLSRRSEIRGLEHDRGFTETSRGTVILENGIVMSRLSGAVNEDGVVMVLDMLESQVPIDGKVYLSALFVSYFAPGEERETVAFAEGIVQSLSITPSADTPEPSEPAGPLGFLDGALIISELPEDWNLLRERDDEVTLRSIGGYQGFITIETGPDAVTAADLSVTFTGAVTESRSDIMGVPARLFEGRKDHDGFLQGYTMVGGPRFLALADACLPNGARVAITWAGSPLWFEQGAFDRFFEVARFDGLVPCDAQSVAPAANSPPPANVPATAPTEPVATQPDVQSKPDAAQADADVSTAIGSDVATPQPDMTSTVAPPPVAQRDTGDADQQAEILFWETVRDMDTPAAFEAYLNRWPDGQFAPLARLRLGGASQPPPAEATPLAPPPDIKGAAQNCEQLTGDTITDAFAAITACREALTHHPNAADLHLRLARALQASGADAEAVTHLQQAADSGLPAAMSALGVAYRQGQGVAPDDRMAIRWYRAAADAGDAQAMNNLGFMLGQGLGGADPNPVEAAHWYLRAAEAGSVFGMNNIGRYYLDGHGVAQDYAQARYWLQQGAEAGHYPAMNNLGTLYGRGLGGPVDHQQAMMWYQRAADAGEASAMANVALAYSHGWGVAANPADAAYWFEQSIRGGAGVSVLGVLDGLPRPVIRALQLRLSGAGVYAGTADGVAGPQTRNAVQALDGRGG